MKRLFPAIALLTLGCQAPTPGWLAVPDPKTKDGVEVVVDGVLRGSTWISGVTGTATNVSDSRITRCRVSFEAYSMHGAPLGTARAEVDGLDAGEAWEFEAKFPGRIPNARTLSSARIVVTR